MAVVHLHPKNVSNLPPSEPPNELAQKVEKLENQITDMRIDFAGLKSKIETEIPHLASKSDLNATQATLIKWMIGTSITIAGLAFTAARFLN